MVGIQEHFLPKTEEGLDLQYHGHLQFPVIRIQFFDQLRQVKKFCSQLSDLFEFWSSRWEKSLKNLDDIVIENKLP